jgi:hypothetical protein
VEITIPTHYVGWVESYYNKWRPPMREGATLSSVAGKLFLIGGISSKLFNDVAVWDSKEWN